MEQLKSWLQVMMYFHSVKQTQAYWKQFLYNVLTTGNC